jgi:hypothetical protein
LAAPRTALYGFKSKRLCSWWEDEVDYYCGCIKELTQTPRSETIEISLQTLHVNLCMITMHHLGQFFGTQLSSSPKLWWVEEQVAGELLEIE